MFSAENTAKRLLHRHTPCSPCTTPSAKVPGFPRSAPSLCWSPLPNSLLPTNPPPSPPASRRLRARPTAARPRNDASPRIRGGVYRIAGRLWDKVTLFFFFLTKIGLVMIYITTSSRSYSNTMTYHSGPENKNCFHSDLRYPFEDHPETSQKTWSYLSCCLIPL